MVKVYLNKAFKNHPAGTELDVSPRVHQLLIDRGVISEPKKKPSTKPKKEEEKEEAGDAS